MLVIDDLLHGPDEFEDIYEVTGESNSFERDYGNEGHELHKIVISDTGIIMLFFF